MSEANQSINTNSNLEISRLEIRQSPSVLIMRLVGTAIFMILILLLFGFLKDVVNDFFGRTVYETVTSDFFLLFIGFGIYALISLYLVLQWKSIMYIIYPKQVVFKSGILAKNQKVSEMKMYTAAHYHQGVFGRIFGYGTLSLDYLGTGLKFDTLSNIPDPEFYLDNIAGLIQQNAQEPTEVR